MHDEGNPPTTTADPARSAGATEFGPHALVSLCVGGRGLSADGRLRNGGAMMARFALLTVLLTASAVEAAPSVPVRVGGEPGRPACATRAVLNDRDKDDEGLVPVRSGPARSFRAITRLPVGTQVYLCDRTGTFVGIIYGEGSCGLDQPADRRAAYRGECESGWVPRRSADATAESSS